MMLSVKFRPSSHSEDGTIVATFKSVEDAKKAFNLVRLRGGRRLENQVAVACNDAESGTLNEVREILEGCNPSRIEDYGIHHKLVIEVTLPKQVTLKTVPLVVDRETANIVMRLVNWLGNPEEITTPKTKKLIFHYEGDEYIFSNHISSDEPYRAMYIADHRVRLTKAVKVRGLY